MDDDEMQAFEVRDFEIERVLDSYARARLQPDPQAMARTRARVMREARLQFEAARIAAHVTPAILQASHRSMTRRIAMPLLAASVWLGIAVGSISAAQAGGPLYPTRMWVENATMPAIGASRTAAELGRLDARLAEAYAASVHGDPAGVQAALDAYQVIADQSIADAAGDADLEALVAAALDKHQGVLAAVAASLAEKGNLSAGAAVQAAVIRAIAHNQTVVDRVKATGEGSSNGNGHGNANGSGAGGSGSGGSGSGSGSGSGGGGLTGTSGPGGGGSGPIATPTPKPTNPNAGPPDKPEKTPKPTPDHPGQPTPGPTDEATPDHTPRGDGNH
jgi:hypothetical protein